MISFKSLDRVLLGTVCICLLAITLTLIHVQVNYPPDIRQIVRGKAVLATLIISFPLASFVLLQMRKNQLLSAELQRIINRDRLTDVATRDFFFARMEEKPDAYGISLMIDIDHFKSVNDTFGHIVGDTVIREVAQVLRDTVRERDIVCRFGGEEFIVFLFDHGKTTGFELAERMRKRIACHRFDPALSDIAITISIGGSLKDRLSDFNLAIKQADDALYLAKAGGRNKTVFAHDHKADAAA